MEKPKQSTVVMAPEDLDRIRNWSDEYYSLMEFIYPRWDFSNAPTYWGRKGPGRRGFRCVYEICVGGSHRNKQIILALMDNRKFWLKCLYYYSRPLAEELSGTYRFEVPHPEGKKG